MINVTGAIIFNENKDKVLIAKRKKGGELGGKWELPGGKIEEGETPEKCLQRELKEELKIEVKVNGFFTENIHSYEWDIIKLLSYFVNWTGGKVKPQVHERVEWVETKDLDSYEFAPADIPIVNELRKNNEVGFKKEYE